jgi:hypothetical protein
VHRGLPGAGLDPVAVRVGREKAMLSAMEPANSGSSCITVPIRLRQRARPRRASGRPSMQISPACGP